MSSKSSRNIQALYPATPMQQGMLFHSVYAASSGVYVEQLQFTLDRAINLEAFRQAWQQIIDQCDVLRTCFILQRDQPLQVVLKRIDLPWQSFDWQHLSSEEQQQKLQEWLRCDREQSFDTAKAPLMRCTLITLSKSRYQFIWTHHHTLLDGWSISILLQDLLSFYQANCQGQVYSPSHRPPYQNYIAWLQQQDRGLVEAYWQQKLAGFYAPTPLPVQPLHEAKMAALDAELHEQSHLISKDLTATLQSWLRQQRVSLAVLIYSVWGVLLSRYSGESDVVFGVTVSGRTIPLAGVEDMVGLFINTLPLRITLPANCSGEILLKQLQQDLQDLQAHSYTSLVEVQRLSELPANHSLFQSLVVIENFAAHSSLSIGQTDLPIQNMTVTERTNYPIKITVVPGEQLSLKFSYNSELFTADVIARMATHFETLLTAITADIYQSIATLPMLTISERLAYHLQDLGVGSETLVGICMERSPEMVIGLLGILKAGGAYVPLDPNYPKDRLEYMLHDSQVTVLVTQTHVAPKLPKHQARQICIDAHWQSSYPSDNLASKIDSENLAYAIYTSGSTGKPKGVQGLHRGTVNRLHWMWKNYPFEPGELCCQKTSLSFVDSVWEIFGGLLQGIPTLIIPDIAVKDPYRLIETLSIHQVSRIIVVPSLLSAILDSCTDLKHKLQSVKYWVSSGEVLDADLSLKFYRCFGRSLLINLYGSSEVSADATYYEVPPRFSVLPSDSSCFSKALDSFLKKNPLAPQTPEEEVLIEIWKQTLDLVEIGVQDNFFELGGNWQLAAKVISLIQYLFDISLPTNIFLQAPNIQSLAAVLRQNETEPGRVGAISQLLKQIQMVPQ